MGGELVLYTTPPPNQLSYWPACAAATVIILISVYFSVGTPMFGGGTWYRANRAWPWALLGIPLAFGIVFLEGQHIESERAAYDRYVEAQQMGEVGRVTLARYEALPVTGKEVRMTRYALSDLYVDSEVIDLRFGDVHHVTYAAMNPPPLLENDKVGMVRSDGVLYELVRLERPTQQ